MREERREHAAGENLKVPAANQQNEQSFFLLCVLIRTQIMATDKGRNGENSRRAKTYTPTESGTKKAEQRNGRRGTTGGGDRTDLHAS
jgi:predicted alpha/beta superfamily hydrolase